MELVLPMFLPTVLAVAGREAWFPVGRVFCIGRNYRWPGQGAAGDGPPDWFVKPASAVVPATGTLPYPPGTDDFCHEVELVVAIGRGGRGIDPARVEPEHVWGYAVGLDLTRRDLQQRAKRVGGPWAPAKVFDGAAPCGPIVPAAVCGHPRQGAIWLAVDGTDRQRADLADLLCPIPALVAMLSRSLTLAPGDLIFTGTPAGVGRLRPGETLTAGVAGVGAIEMTVVAA